MRTISQAQKPSLWLSLVFRVLAAATQLPQCSQRILKRILGVLPIKSCWAHMFRTHFDPAGDIWKRMNILKRETSSWWPWQLTTNVKKKKVAADGFCLTTVGFLSPFGRGGGCADAHWAPVRTARCSHQGWNRGGQQRAHSLLQRYSDRQSTTNKKEPGRSHVRPHWVYCRSLTGPPSGKYYQVNFMIRADSATSLKAKKQNCKQERCCRIAGCGLDMTRN